MAANNSKESPLMGQSHGQALKDSELEKYGVWVKAEPQDILLDETVSSEDFSLDIPDMPELNDALSADSLLSSEEEQELGSLAFESNTVDENISLMDDDEIKVDFSPNEIALSSKAFTSEELDSSSTEATDSSSIEDISFDDIEVEHMERTPIAKASSGMEEISLDDFGLDDLNSTDTSETKKASPLQHESISLDEFGIDGSGSDENESNASEEDTGPLDINLEFDDTIEDSMNVEEEISFDPSDFEDEIPHDSGMKIESVNDFDDFLSGNEAPADESALLKSKTEPKAKASPKPQSSASTDDTIVLDLQDLPEIIVESDQLESVSDSSKDSKNDFETSSFNTDKLPELDLEEMSMHSTEETVEEPDFDDIGAVEKDLSEQSERVQNVAQKTQDAVSGSQSAEILHKIASELSSIKDELFSLKAQLSAIRSEGATPQTAEKPAQDEDMQAKGFFEDDNDEVIALTGDELDNILNTADFTEEAGEAQEADTSDFSDLSALAETPLLDEDNIISEDGSPIVESTKKNPAIEEVTLDGSKISDEELEPETPSFNELPILDDIIPATEAPEDTSYLEHEDIDLGNIELDEPPLEEPDLSSIDDQVLDSINEPIEELSLENELNSSDETIELIETDDFAATEELEDISLDFDDTNETINLMHEDKDVETNMGSFESMPSDADLQELSLDGEAASMFETDLLEEPLFVDEQVSSSSNDVEEISLSESIELDEPLEMDITQTESLAVHPDDVSMGLDDSFFVSPATLDNEKPIKESRPETKSAAPKEAQTELSTPVTIKEDIKSILKYMDSLLESLPEEKVEEFAKSEHFAVYKKLFEELGLV